MNGLRDETFSFPGQAPVAIKLLFNRALVRAYKKIVSDPSGGQVYEPVAYAIREEWAFRGYPKSVLNKIEKQFRNMKRRK